MSVSAVGLHQEKPLKKMSDLHLMRRLLGYVWAQPRLFGLSLLLYPVTAAAVVLPPYLVQEILDDAIPNRDLPALRLYTILYLLAVVFEYVSGLSSQFAMSVLGQRAMRSLRNELFEHVQRLPARFFDRNPIGRVLTRLTNDVDALGEVFATGAVTIIGDLITVSAVVGMMFVLDVRLTLYSFLVVPPLVALTLVFRIYARKAFRAIRTQLARINTFLSEHISGMAVVQLFRQQARTAGEFAELNLAYRDANRSAILFDALLFSVVEAIGTAAVAAMLWWGANDLSTGVVGAGTFIAFVQYIRRFFIPIRDLSTKYTVLQSAFAAAERIFGLRDEPLPIRSKDSSQPVTGIGREIQLRDVWFAYGESDSESERSPQWVLRGVTLQIPVGQKIALVGATGSGKTTILKLLNRTYDVLQGAVTIDGVDIREVELSELRKLFAVVLQDVTLFSGTIMDNLRFGDAQNEEAVIAAAKAVTAHDFIMRLPQGYQTPVREQGVNFSAGERQLLAFARALATDPEVLILDEATSSVDSETEARIQAALDVLLEGRTAVIVAHRLSTIRKVDRIVVMQHGRVVQEGDHESLMKEEGVYRTLAELHFGAEARRG